MQEENKVFHFSSVRTVLDAVDNVEADKLHVTLSVAN
jgi:hypothetical protein